MAMVVAAKVPEGVAILSAKMIASCDAQFATVRNTSGQFVQREAKQRHPLDKVQQRTHMSIEQSAATWPLFFAMDAEETQGTQTKRVEQTGSHKIPSNAKQEITKIL